MFAFPKKETASVQETYADKILISVKPIHRGALFGHISNGGGTIDLGNGYSMQFICNGSQFVTAQLFHHGIGKQVQSQQWQKSKVIVEKKVDPVIKEDKIETRVESGDLL